MEELRQNQISHLFIWVHPTSQPVGPRILAEWKAFVELLSFESHIALVETLGIGLKPIRASNPSDNTYFQSIREIELLAESLLGKRYILWPSAEGLGGKFVLGRDASHVDLLRTRLKIEARMHHPRSSHAPSMLFSSIGCYGLRPDVCVGHQVYAMGLEHLANTASDFGVSPLRAVIGSNFQIPSNRASKNFIASRTDVFTKEDIERARRVLRLRGQQPIKNPMQVR